MKLKDLLLPCGASAPMLGLTIDVFKLLLLLIFLVILYLIIYLIF
jgi:hypothetical protein